MTAQRQKFEPLTPADEERLRHQRAVIEQYLGDDDTSRMNYLKPPGKLGLLRANLNEKIFDPSQTHELQCMGIILGDAIVMEVGWLWRMVEDEYGRDPCVKVPGSSVVLYPLTMISKRVERVEDVDVFALFNLVVADVEKLAKTADPRAD